MGNINILINYNSQQYFVTLIPLKLEGRNVSRFNKVTNNFTSTSMELEDENIKARFEKAIV